MRDVWILGECSASDEARLRSFAGDALRELAADVSMPLHLAEEPRADLRPSTRGWMSAAGAHLVADALERGDLDLRHLVYHEAAHWVARGEYPALRGPFWQETWAVWFATRFAPPHTRRIPPLKASNNTRSVGWPAPRSPAASRHASCSSSCPGRSGCRWRHSCSASTRSRIRGSP